jgi:hypothetical protein
MAEVRRNRVPYGDRGVHRGSARTAPIGKRRHLGLAQRAAEQHGAMMARSRSPLKAAFSAQRSAFSLFSPTLTRSGEPSLQTHIIQP